MAAEGMVLLKNDGLLPLKLSEPVALLGAGAVKTIKGGIGSGDVNNRENHSIYQGMQEAGAVLVSKDWLDAYENCYDMARAAWRDKILEEAEHVENPFDAYAANPFVLPQGRMISETDVEGAKAAVYVVSRISGEGKDRRKEAGDYYLSEREREELLWLSGKKIPTVLVLNSGGVIELTDILEEAGYIRSVLSVSQPGQEAGRAAADVLYGKKTPGGRLTATWARRYEDYPCASSFGYLSGDTKNDEYKEGIFVGYRYFDSFGIKPLFPFGYGLSYTSFETEFLTLRIKNGGIEADVTVKNTGDRYSGKEVVQIYVTLPQGTGVRERQRLAGFAKTKSLMPGESQTVTVLIPQKQLASYDERQNAWLVEAGRYGIWYGNHSASLHQAAVLHVSKSTVLERTHRVCEKKGADWSREAAEAGFGAGKAEEPLPGPALQETAVPEYEFEPHEECVRKYQGALADGLPVEDLLPLLYGNITKGASTLGSAGVRVPGSAGETTEALEEKYGIRSLIMADGPAGLRLRQSYEADKKSGAVYGAGILGSLENGFLEPMIHHENADTRYQFCTAFPVGTALAQTWDEELMQEFGKAVAAEMREFHVDLWLAPGMNIQRNPLCGRNFEYYSEDPYLSGRMAAAVTRGVQSRKGCGVTLKHFACNNQEDSRMDVDVHISERALREIYLRGFEIAVKESAPAALMSSYNLINGIHAANWKALCTEIARKEWGFDGVIMSDWNTAVPENGSIPWKCAAAGNDIIMPGNDEDARNLREAYEKGLLTEREIRECAGRILRLTERLG